MDIDYRNNDTKRICNDKGYALKYFPPKVVDSLTMLLYKLAATSTFARFRRNPTNKKYNIHNMKGEEKELISLRLDYQYRMTIKILVENVNGQDKILVWEVSNHYDD